VTRYLKDYRASDDPTHVDATGSRLIKHLGKNTCRTAEVLNGFCLVAKVADWFALAHSQDQPFNPRYRMTRNEDELEGRWARQGRRFGVACTSFVFHYRRLSRGGRGGKPDEGLYRPKKRR
jgi:hypothetical protein